MAGISVMNLLLLVVGRVIHGAGAVEAVYESLVLVAIGAIVLVMIGVVLPAVWSRKPARRQAAAEVLRLLLFKRGRQRARFSPRKQG